MEKLESIFVGRTFYDFLLPPQFSILETRKDPERKLLKMPLSRNISLSLPIVAANMDTVTGEEMAKAMSLEGAIAFLPRNLSIQDQAEMVRRVQHQHSFVIDEPLKLQQSATLAEAKLLMRKHGKSGILVEDRPNSGILAGILSHRNIPLDASNDNREISFFMTKFSNKDGGVGIVFGHPDISIEEAERRMYEGQVEKLPLIEEKTRKIRGLITMKDLRLAKQKPYSSKDVKGRLLVGAAIGANGDYLERATELIGCGARCILIDIAHFHSIVGRRATESFRKKFPDAELIVGNIATAEAAIDALDWGVDAVKVGIGPGRGCRTRLETWFGVPQLQAIRQVYLALEGKVPIIADGGIEHDGQIFLAIAAGADTVMLGSMLAGTDESPGILIEDPRTNQKKKMYRGSTSPQAIIDSIRDENDIAEAIRTPAEGQLTEIPYTGGSVVDVLNRIAGHLTSAISYSGQANLQSAHEKIARNAEKYFSTWLSLATQRESFER